MREDRATGPYLAQRFQPGARLARKDVVLAAHGQRKPIALRKHDARWPYFDVDLVHSAKRELLLLVVRVIRPVWQRKLGVELTVRAAQPALGLSLIHISEPTRRTPISYAVFCLKKKKKDK